MGKYDVQSAKNGAERKRFLKHLIGDVEALDRMLKKGMMEKGVQRIGAEQELSLVDKFFKPSRIAPYVLEKVDDPHFTTELALYNMEVNLDPLELKDQCFVTLEKQLRLLLRKAGKAAKTFENHIVLAGILPSIDIRSGQIDFMTPNPRYYALSEIIKELRGQDFELNILGVDELILAHTNILFEACNTSFQCHLQVSAEDFVDQYNWAQMISGPVLSVCTNSPMLFGRELWSETRIALFQQSIDTRSKGYYLREKQQRVSFGQGWIRNATDIYKEDIARFTLILTDQVQEDSLKKLDEGLVPDLSALNLHNGTIWKWNRPCYGLNNGLPHLRIENRYLPSGPSVTDQIANFAFWVGLMKAMPDHYRSKWKNHAFEDTKGNFYKAATAGMHSSMVWEGQIVPARTLVAETLVPLAREGLKKVGLGKSEIEQYLDVILERANAGLDGSTWAIKSFRNLKKRMTKDEAAVTLTAAMVNRQESEKPVHKWRMASMRERKGIEVSYDWIGSIMVTDLITVQEEDLVELAEKIMIWKNIRHIPVEDAKGNLKGLITKNSLEKYFETHQREKLALVKDVMNKELVTVGPDTDIKFAILLMIDRQISCLPVVDGSQLIGLVTDKDTQETWEKLKSDVKLSE